MVVRGHEHVYLLRAEVLADTLGEKMKFLKRLRCLIGYHEGEVINCFPMRFSGLHQVQCKYCLKTDTGVIGWCDKCRHLKDALCV